jgi:hypothetical protein
MPDLTEGGVTEWFTPIRPPGPRKFWPPVFRHAECAPSITPLLEDLGSALSELQAEGDAAMAYKLQDENAFRDLQVVVAQLGGARLLRILEGFASSFPEGKKLIARLTRGPSTEAQTIQSALHSLTGRATISRMFNPDRVVELQTCAQVAAGVEENP